MFLRNKSGATAIEYCFIAGIVSIAIITGLTATGVRVGALFASVANHLN